MAYVGTPIDFTPLQKAGEYKAQMEANKPSFAKGIGAGINTGVDNAFEQLKFKQQLFQKTMAAMLEKGEPVRIAEDGTKTPLDLKERAMAVAYAIDNKELPPGIMLDNSEESTGRRLTFNTSTSEYGLPGGKPLQEGYVPSAKDQIDRYTPFSEENYNNKVSGNALAKSKPGDTRDLYELVNFNNDVRTNISNARDALKNINFGLGGKIERGAFKYLKPNDPTLGEWQKVKSILTNAQLLYTAKTKGAISDREMELFRDAAANDDISSMPQILTVFANMESRMKAAEDAAAGAYNRNYNEDPKLWKDLKFNTATSAQPQSTKTVFNSVEEAEAAKLPKGTVVTIGGRKAVIE